MDVHNVLSDLVSVIYEVSSQDSNNVDRVIPKCCLRNYFLMDLMILKRFLVVSNRIILNSNTKVDVRIVEIIPVFKLILSDVMFLRIFIDLNVPISECVRIFLKIRVVLMWWNRYLVSTNLVVIIFYLSVEWPMLCKFSREFRVEVIFSIRVFHLRVMYHWVFINQMVVVEIDTYIVDFCRSFFNIVPIIRVVVNDQRIVLSDLVSSSVRISVVVTISDECVIIHVITVVDT